MCIKIKKIKFKTYFCSTICLIWVFKIFILDNFFNPIKDQNSYLVMSFKTKK